MVDVGTQAMADLDALIAQLDMPTMADPTPALSGADIWAGLNPTPASPTHRRQAPTYKHKPRAGFTGVGSMAGNLQAAIDSMAPGTVFTMAELFYAANGMAMVNPKRQSRHNLCADNVAAGVLQTVGGRPGALRAPAYRKLG